MIDRLHVYGRLRFHVLRAINSTRRIKKQPRRPSMWVFYDSQCMLRST